MALLTVKGFAWFSAGTALLVLLWRIGFSDHHSSLDMLARLSQLEAKNSDFRGSKAREPA